MKYLSLLFVLFYTHCAIAQAVYSQDKFTEVRDLQGFTIVSHQVAGTTKYGLIDMSKRFVLEPQYDQIKAWSTIIKFIAFKYNGKWGTMSVDGKTIGQPKYSSIDFLTIPMIVVLNDKRGFIDESANEIITPQYDSAGYFTYTDMDKKDKAGMLARVKRNGKWGFINKMNQTVIPFQYDGASRFILMLAPVMKGGLWGYIDPTGQLVIPYKYTRVGDFNKDGEANVELNGKWIVIDRKGNKLKDSEEEDEEDF
ncbi:MAG: hypothetical protein K0Q66_1802 [Chitinophagaceae bacterium]|jgi:hypothetical protein|nr:hypothetical protein [Chitinophagaceae bacterium]